MINRSQIFIIFLFISFCCACSDALKYDEDFVPVKVKRASIAYDYPFRLRKLNSKTSVSGISDMDISDDGKWIVYSQFEGKVCISEFLSPDETLERGCTSMENISAQGENGLNSIALEKNFSENGIFYAAFQNPTGARIVRQIKMKWNQESKLWVRESSLDLLKSSGEVSVDNHMIGGIVVVSEGRIIVSIGDGQQTGLVQDDRSLYGKIIELNLNEPSNSESEFDHWHLSGSMGKVRVLAKGFRMPWRMEAGPQQTIWIGDVGSSRYEELNCFQLNSESYSIKDFGWPLNEGPIDSLNSDFNGPVFSWSRVDYAGLRVTDPLSRDVSRSAIWIGAFFPDDESDNDPYQNILDGSLLMSDIEAGWIRSVKIDSHDHCRLESEEKPLLFNTSFISSAKINPLSKRIYFSKLRSEDLYVLELSAKATF